MKLLIVLGFVGFFVGVYSRERCVTYCPTIYQPVCGSDGVTYPNECTMKSKACQANQHVSKDHDGICQGRCQFPCTKHIDPVCGHNGNTYSNECMLRLAACKLNKPITLVHKGKCRPADDKHRCAIACSKVYRPVCGSNGQKYANECGMKVDSCDKREAISVVKYNVGINLCNDCHIGCSREYRPVCGSDGNTHPNECVLRENACNKKEAITLIYAQPC